jgi:FtsP/CotA-like multicopper oxidase with cupredoxin domain
MRKVDQSATRAASRPLYRALVIPLCAMLLLANSPRATAPALAAPERIATNDNRLPGGVLRGVVLTIRLEARTGDWRPDRDSDPGLNVFAFGEEGRSLQNPGPLIRVPRGTEIHAFIRNSIPDSTLVVRGLFTRGIPSAADTVQIRTGQVREVRFRADVAGTFHYWGTTTGASAVGQRIAVESQLNGAIVVDDENSSSRDRIFVLALWSQGGAPGGVVGRSDLLRFVINGKAWPNTERLTYTVGDSVRFRLVNSSGAPHPMHLHGFYFTVDSRGDLHRDSVYSAQSRNFAVTERLTGGRTISLTWIPERSGNWMFHCHDNFHVLRNQPLDGSPLPPEHKQHVGNHARDMMGGLVMGVEVLPNRSATTVGEESAGPRRRLRLIARVDSGGTDDEPAYGYVLDEGGSGSRARSPLLPGPTIVLRKGEPVSIMVVNELPEATAVHWHGIELDSYYDGVADFAGHPGRIAPVIAPRDSFDARFTPPRSGSFMYHPHADETRQQQAGLSGAIVVVDDPGAFSPAHDIPLLISVPRRDADRDVVLLNGTSTPGEREMRVGERYRLRVINIHTFRPSMIARIVRDSTVLTWRAVAKDGMDLPPAFATMRPAAQQLGNGEAYDFEFIPSAPGLIRFTVTTGTNVPLVTMPIRVR